MKIISNLTKIALFAFLTTNIFSSCSDDNNTNVPTPQVDNTIAGIASRANNLTLLVKALKKANLVTTLSGNGPFTVFAPTDQAFIDAGFTAAAIDALPDNDNGLIQTLLNHVVSGAVLSTALVDQSYIKTLGKGSASTTNTLSMFVDKTSGVKLNGVSTVTTPNIAATNGVIHVVDKVITLPTIVTHAKANPLFSTLYAVVTSTTGTFGNQSAVATALTTNTTPLTVFAPTNAAFTAATTGTGFITGAAVTAANVTKVLQYHVTGAGNVLAASLTQGQSIPTITNPVQNLTIDLVGGAKISDTSPTKANIIATNVQCANGIIHAVDKVLQPTL
jgi:uncharacterized surface protein with fasciclin (FAS1) repeats